MTGFLAGARSDGWDWSLILWVFIICGVLISIWLPVLWLMSRNDNQDHDRF